jgi:hypothetical protein
MKIPEGDGVLALQIVQASFAKELCVAEKQHHLPHLDCG